MNYEGHDVAIGSTCGGTIGLRVKHQREDLSLCLGYEFKGRLTLTGICPGHFESLNVITGESDSVR